MRAGTLARSFDQLRVRSLAEAACTPGGRAQFSFMARSGVLVLAMVVLVGCDEEGGTSGNRYSSTALGGDRRLSDLSFAEGQTLCADMGRAEVAFLNDPLLIKGLCVQRGVDVASAESDPAARRGVCERTRDACLGGQGRRRITEPLSDCNPAGFRCSATVESFLACRDARLVHLATLYGVSADCDGKEGKGASSALAAAWDRRIGACAEVEALCPD